MLAVRAIRQFTRATMAASLPRHRFMARGPRSSNSVCLTFDDGPDPVNTSRVLDLLRKTGVPATFFVIGERAERHPELLRRIASEGHTLGHHTFTHSDPKRTTARKLLDEVHQTAEVLTRAVGEAPTLFRPPHGKLTATKLWRLWQMHQSVILWNVDPKDFACQSSSELRSWFHHHPLRSGDIVLLHDDRSFAADVLGELIDTTRASGLNFTTPSTWLGIKSRK